MEVCYTFIMLFYEKHLFTSDIASEHTYISLVSNPSRAGPDMWKNSLWIWTIVSLLAISSYNAVYAQEEGIEPISGPIIEAITTFFNNLAESAPKVMAAAILLAIGYGAGKAAGKGVENLSRKVLRKANLEKVSAGQVLEQVTGKDVDSPRLIGATVKWFIYLFFIVAAINALQFAELSGALSDLWLWVPNILAFILIIVIGFIIVNFVARWIDQEFARRDFSGTYIVTAVKVIMYAVIFAVGITQLGVGETIIPILVSAFSWSIAIAIGAAIAIGLGFGLKDIIPAAISGAAHQRAVLKVGQKVRIGDISGTITAVELLHVIVVNDKNESVIIPTKELMSKPITVIGS